MSKVHDAEELLDNPAFQYAIEEYSKQLVTQWSFAATAAEREALWYQQRAVTTVVNKLKSFVDEYLIR